MGPESISRRQVLGWAAAAGANAVIPLGGGLRSPLVAEAWLAAEAPFRNDPKWIGGDSAYSVDLGHGRVLWLFGDSFIANTAARSRGDAVMVRNALAIQTGYDITTAKLRFYWDSSAATPTSFFRAPTPTTWLWPGDGVMVGKRLILFLDQIAASPGGLGFKNVGWTAIAIENPDSDPTGWTVTRLTTELQFGVTLGGAAIVVDGYLYAYSAGLTQSGPTYLARWPVSSVSNNSLTSPEWYGGALGWASAGQLPNGPTPVAAVGQSEFSIFPVAKPAPYLLIQTMEFGASRLGYETTSSLTGGYSGARSFYNPPEMSKPNVMIYSAKMHPELLAPGYDVVATYCTNSTNFSTLVNDKSLYFPRFVRAKWRT